MRQHHADGVRPIPTNEQPKRPRKAARKASVQKFAPLKTERLSLRPLREQDAEALHRLVNDWEVTRTLAEIPYPYPRALADEWIASTAAQLADGTGYHLAITGTEGATETLVGLVGLRVNTARRTGRLGYWVGRAYWGHGVATEAAKRLTSWGFANLPLDHITAEVTEGNDASCAVLRRVGFRETGTGVRASLTTGTDHTVSVFEATRDDIFGLLERLWQERGLTVIMVTHDSALAKRVPRLAQIKNGKLTIKRERVEK